MQDKIKTGIIMTFAGIGALMISINLLSAAFVAGMITVVLGSYCLVFIRRNITECRLKELNHGVKIAGGRLFYHTDFIKPEPPEPPLEPEKTALTGSPEITGSDSENLNTGGGGVEDYKGRKIPDHLWPKEIDNDTEKVILLYQRGWSQNAASFGVFGGKGDNYAFVQDIYRRLKKDEDS